ncbi:hypothetical protein P7C70_g5831, partial [Phenoliferia sp. Uapishka_3]
MARLDLAELHTFACQLSIDAGSYLRDQALARASRARGAVKTDLELTIKENAADLVTQADLHAEAMIMGAIRERYPQHKIIGEESYSAGQEKRFLLDDDVCAGAIIVLEAGGRFVPSQPPESYKDGDAIPDADLGSRLYLALRPCSATVEESEREQQDRLVKEVWRRAEPLDYIRPT